MKHVKPLTGLAVGAAVVTVALTGVAFWLSYEHLHDVADGNGLDGERAWAWPATVDLFIIAGELLMLRASLRGKGMDWWAVALAAIGSLGSIALNVAGVGEGARGMEYVVAAVPPVAALLAFGALMRQVHETLSHAVQEPDVESKRNNVPLAPAVEEGAETAPTPVVLERVPAPPTEVPGVPAPQVSPTPAYPELEAAYSPDYFEEIRQAFAKPTPEAVYPAAEVPPTRAEVRAEYTPEDVPGEPVDGRVRLDASSRSTPGEPVDDSPPPPAEDTLTPQARQDFPDGAGVAALREKYRIGQKRAQRIRDELKGATVDASA